jgi:hypothetical protein
MSNTSQSSTYGNFQGTGGGHGGGFGIGGGSGAINGVAQSSNGFGGSVYSNVLLRKSTDFIPGGFTSNVLHNPNGQELGEHG